MADNKRRDDLVIEMGNRGSTGGYESPRLSKGPQTPRISAPSSIANNPMLAVLSYCGSSILMTVLNKYVVSGKGWNMNFLLLIVQNLVCVTAIRAGKSLGLINFRNFNADEARKWFPVSLLLVGMIYTSTKALQYLSIPVFTIFKNLTIIVTAYGEVLWFGGSVTRLTLFSFGLIVLSSVVAAWADIQHALSFHGSSSEAASEKISTLNAGYMWMLMNCFCTSSYVLGMRKRIKLTNFKDFDTMFYNNLLSVPVLVIFSLLVEDWSTKNLMTQFPIETRNNLMSAMFITGVGTIFISYTSAWCVRVTSSTTYSMVGALNKIPIAISGLVFFDAPVTLPSVSAIAIGSASGIVYAVAKMRAAQQPKTVGLPTANPMISASSQSARDSMKS
ncbi:GDP-mannose transporter into the lumen of the Golgi [Agyrium rufum]|nr:GDP-mannose transporter into the lumen of the Golgi [Agyrium rufum]